jgi:Rps23 Pro-64 3,4-dihydroxylase Tpa1-like proline 4-hydroxylase
MFNACQDLVHCCLGFPQYKGVTFCAQCLTKFLDIEKIEIQKQTKNSSCFGMAHNDNYKSHQTLKQSL